MIIRKARKEDLAACDAIYAAAKEYMHSNGNPTQWNGAYPCAEDTAADIEKGIGYVCEDEGEVVAVFAFEIANDSTYDNIYDGMWKNDEPYAYIHRIAVKHHGRGIVGFCFSECFKMYPNLKIDTHKNNIPMQRALTRSGFEYCGIIYIDNPNATKEENARLAFQKTK